MNLKFFIDRPVLSAVISVVIMLLGAIGLASLPIEQYPEIAPPTIQVYTQYPGANAETVQKAVIVPLEEAINGVEGLNYITSTASNSGDVTINIYFKQKTDPDMAAVNVQNRVSKALGLLPAEVTKIGVTTEKQQNAELKTFALYAPEDKYDRQFLNNYLKINVEPRIKRVSGVGNVMQLGSNYSMRIWLKPDKMAQYKLVPSDISAVLANQNIEAATGQFGENHDNAHQYTMKYRGRLSQPDEFENLVVRSLPNGEVLRLKEVADIELGDEAYNYNVTLNGHPAAMSIIYQTSGSNASQTINEIDRVLEELSAGLPAGMEFVTLNDTNRFLYASIHEVVETLLIAILLVAFVVYLFLQDLRSTFIPTVAIFVSIIGTFAVLQAIGFSINLLTLFALVLAIGTVVDDAIVVVEAVQAKFDEGCRSSYKAAIEAMGNVASAILTSTLIFMAVFIPVSMIGGTSGEFYKQFGLTMAIAVGISAINAFTLSPALCALLLRPYKDEFGREKNNFAARFRRRFNKMFETFTGGYLKGVNRFVKRRWAVWSILTVSVMALVLLMHGTKTGLVPQEDTGTVLISINLKPGSSMEENKKMLDKFGKRLSEIPAIQYHADVSGYSFDGAGPSMGMVFVSLRPWDERKSEEASAYGVLYSIYELATEFPGMEMFAMTPPMIPGYGMSSGFELYLQDKLAGDVHEFKKVADAFIAALSERPEIGQVYSSFKTDYPQYWVDIDAAKCEQAGITSGEVLQTLGAYYSGEYISDFNRFSKIYRVMMQGTPDSRITPESLNHVFARTTNGKMIPLSQFVKLTKTSGPSDLSRFNLYNSLPISGMAAEGYSTGEALKAIKETAAEILSANYSYELGGLSREEEKTTGSSAIIFAICLVLIYLILCALYESIFVPLAIILSVPCGLLGCFIFAQAFGLENNIYMQTGIIMLIGLLAKTAILLTEYAAQCRKGGASLKEAAVVSAKIRFRPILMTALTMIFGLIPLMFSNGAGAYGNFSLSSTAVGGMLIGTLALLFLVPPLFMVFQNIQEKVFSEKSAYNSTEEAVQTEPDKLKKGYDL